MSKEVDADLYDFMKDRECHVYLEGDSIHTHIFINFDDLSDFVKIVGEGYFDEEGIDIRLKSDCVYIEIDEIITEGYGHYISSYKNCFGTDEWEQYGERILGIESDE